MTRALRLALAITALAVGTWIGSAGWHAAGPANHGHTWAGSTWPPPPVLPQR
ncbi:MAG TPA: hypothetical protein VKX16_05565 [Chloroflexota bacterium]|nr:hypothetical protein [Chloroflexota bacterium]